MYFTSNLLNIHYVYKAVYSFSVQSRSDWVPMPQNPNLTEVFDRFGFSFPVKDSPHAYGVPAPYEPEYRSVEPGFQPAPQYGFPHGAKLPPVLPPTQQIQVTAGRMKERKKDRLFSQHSTNVYYIQHSSLKNMDMRPRITELY
jgi:hypothetical protein